MAISLCEDRSTSSALEMTQWNANAIFGTFEKGMRCKIMQWYRGCSATVKGMSGSFLLARPKPSAGADAKTGSCVEVAHGFGSVTRDVTVEQWLAEGAIPPPSEPGSWGMTFCPAFLQVPCGPCTWRRHSAPASTSHRNGATLPAQAPLYAYRPKTASTRVASSRQASVEPSSAFSTSAMVR